MLQTDLIALAGTLLAIAGSIGAVIRWTAIRLERQAARVRALEERHAKLFREHSLVLVRLERFRLAFQMVASELARRSPGNIALVHARALLDDAFVLEPDPVTDLETRARTNDGRAAA